MNVEKNMTKYKKVKYKSWYGFFCMLSISFGQVVGSEKVLFKKKQKTFLRTKNIKLALVSTVVPFPHSYQPSITKKMDK